MRIGGVFASHMVGHEIDNDFKSSAMGARDQFFKFLDAVGDRHSEVGVDVVVVGYCIRTASFTLDNVRIM